MASLAPYWQRVRGGVVKRTTMAFEWVGVLDCFFYVVVAIFGKGCFISGSSVRRFFSLYVRRGDLGYLIGILVAYCYFFSSPNKGCGSLVSVLWCCLPIAWIVNIRHVGGLAISFDTAWTDVSGCQAS